MEVCQRSSSTARRIRAMFATSSRFLGSPCAVVLSRKSSNSRKNSVLYSSLTQTDACSPWSAVAGVTARSSHFGRRSRCRVQRSSDSTLSGYCSVAPSKTSTLPRARSSSRPRA